MHRFESFCVPVYVCVGVRVLFVVLCCVVVFMWWRLSGGVCVVVVWWCFRVCVMVFFLWWCSSPSQYGEIMQRALTTLG